MPETTETNDLVTNATQAEPEVIAPSKTLAIAAVHISFFLKVKAEFKKIFGHPATYISAASTTMTFIAPLVATVVTLAAPEAAPEATLILAKIQSAVSAASVVIKSSGSEPTIITYLDTVRDNITQLEGALQIKGAATGKNAHHLRPRARFTAAMPLSIPAHKLQSCAVHSLYFRLLCCRHLFAKHKTP